jgi:hypothetical protein
VFDNVKWVAACLVKKIGGNPDNMVVRAEGRSKQIDHFVEIETIKPPRLHVQGGKLRSEKSLKTMCENSFVPECREQGEASDPRLLN